MRNSDRRSMLSELARCMPEPAGGWGSRNPAFGAARVFQITAENGSAPWDFDTLAAYRTPNFLETALTAGQGVNGFWANSIVDYNGNVYLTGDAGISLDQKNYSAALPVTVINYQGYASPSSRTRWVTRWA
jgi:hypothetical protein